MRFGLTILILFCLGFFTTSLAQETTDKKDTSIYLVKKTDGGEFYGLILSDDGREILLETKNIGKIYINKSDISSIKKIDAKTISNSGGTYADYRLQGPFTTRYYFIANAIPLEKNENYALINLYGPEVHVGVTDKLSLGVMSTWIASPIGIAAKYSLLSNESQKTHLALGTIVGSSGYLLNGSGFFGLHWLAATKGTKSANVTLSLGYSYADLGNTGFFSNSIGAKYIYSETSQAQYTQYPQYAVLPEYNARRAMDEELWENNYEDNLFMQGTSGSYVVGLSGITPVGEKASFIFDVLSFVRPGQVVTYSDFDQEITYFNTQFNTNTTETFTIGKGQVSTKGVVANIVLMPAMRFNKSYNQAFQVALAGVIHVEPDDVFTFPVPMISWLRQF